MALRLKKIGDSPPGTIVSTIKSMTEDPESQYSSQNRWLLCDGQTLDIGSNPEYTALFNVIGTKYGGSGSGDFKVPNLHNIAGSKNNALVAGPASNVDNVAVLRGATSANWSQLSNADETASRNNSKNGNLTGNFASVSGNLETSVDTNGLVNTSYSGRPGLNNTPAISAMQMTMRQWPRHDHGQARVARNRQNNGGYRSSGGSGVRQYRSWTWSGDSGGTSGVSKKGGNTAHNHSNSTTIQNVSGNIVVNTSLGSSANHDFRVNVNGTPSLATSIDKHSQLRFYIKY